jgi:hypothetical protein
VVEKFCIYTVNCVVVFMYCDGVVLLMYLACVVLLIYCELCSADYVL